MQNGRKEVLLLSNGGKNYIAEIVMLGAESVHRSFLLLLMILHYSLMPFCLVYLDNYHLISNNL